MRTRTTALALFCACSTLAADAPPLSPLALGRIDAHAHFFAEAKPVLDLLDRLNLTAVNVCVVDRYEKGYETAAPQHAMARHLDEEGRPPNSCEKSHAERRQHARVEDGERAGGDHFVAISGAAIQVVRRVCSRS